MPSDAKISAESRVANGDQYSSASLASPLSAGFNTQRHLNREVFARQHEYTKAKQIRLKTGSWNVASCAGTENDIKAWFIDSKGISSLHGGLPIGKRSADEQAENVATQEARSSEHASTTPKNDTSQLPSNEAIDLYALGLQEIVDINSAAEALKPFNDAAPAAKWKDAVSEALPAGYVLVAEQQLLGLLLLIYASPEIAPTISAVSTTSVGTGLMGYMGNKGAVAARLVVAESTKMVFVNSHLAAGNDKASLERRNWDVSQIIQRTRFAPIDHGNGVVDEFGDYLGQEDFAFWFGDLNYRLSDIPGDDVRRLLLLHTRNEYDHGDPTRQSIDSELKIKAEKHGDGAAAPDEPLHPTEDPASALTTISSLLSHDQLHAQIRARKAFHDGWQEGPIQFLPTYKYDIGSVGMFDSSEKKRSPSWCDRILYRTKKHYKAWKMHETELEHVHKRDEEMKARGVEKDNPEAAVFYDYDPDTDGEEDSSSKASDTKDDTKSTHEGQETISQSSGTVKLEYYVSHQRVLSSDHKPLAAIFSIEYNAVDPDQRSQVYQDVAKEIDRQENEGRPSVTVIFESHDLHDKSSDGCQFGDLRFCQEKTVLMTVANTSPVPATFEFMESETSSKIPSWLRLKLHDDSDVTTPKHSLGPYTLQPGDSANIEVTAFINSMEEVQQFNEERTSPETVLIMRVHKGRDHFITVHGNWLASCFGFALEKLVRLSKDGVRQQKLGHELDKEDIKTSTPRELFKLTESLEAARSAILKSSASLEVLRKQSDEWPFVSRSSEEIAQDNRFLSIREALDTGSQIELPDANAIEELELLGATMVQYLSCMPGRIVSLQLWTVLLASFTELEKIKKLPQDDELRSLVLDVLSVSPPANVSFTLITYMLARMATVMAPVDVGPADQPPAATPSTPTMQETFLKRLSFKSDHPRIVRRKQIETAYIERFLPLVFETDDSLKGTRARKVSFDMKKLVLGAFITSWKGE